jgi:two-component system nitrate/nitrite response regulator NarL
VLSFVFEGMSNKQIADQVQTSETAVKGSLQQLFAKTGVRTRSQLVRVALEQYRDQL